MNSQEAVHTLEEQIRERDKCADSSDTDEYGYMAGVDRRALLRLLDEARRDAERLNYLIDWLGFNEDVRELPVRDWNDRDDARAAIDSAIAQQREGSV